MIHGLLIKMFVDELAAYFGVFPPDMAHWAERGYDYTMNQVCLEHVIVDWCDSVFH